MKRFISLFLAFLFVFSLAACDTDTSSDPVANEEITKPENLSDYTVYPQRIEDFLPDFASIVEPPSEIFSASSIDSCKETVYKFYGLVTAVEEASDKNSNCDSIILKTDFGEIYISSLYNLMIEEVPDAEKNEIAQIFSLPKVGEWVCVYAEYAGFADSLDLPYAALGGLDVITNTFTQVMLENGAIDAIDAVIGNNPLIAAEMHGVSNGTVRRGYIEISKDVFQGITESQYREFVDTCVRDSGYNWVSIICEDGTGICFIGSMGFVAEYGKLDSTGCITEQIGIISITNSGEYVYEEF